MSYLSTLTSNNVNLKEIMEIVKSLLSRVDVGGPKIATGTITFTEETNSFYAEHNLGVVPNFCMVMATDEASVMSIPKYSTISYTWFRGYGAETSCVQKTEPSSSGIISNKASVGVYGASNSALQDSSWNAKHDTTGSTIESAVLSSTQYPFASGVTYVWIVGAI